MKFRYAIPDDCRALLDIYAQYILTPVTFEYALPTETDFRQRITEISRHYPYIVCEENDGRVVGYAYAHRHMEREAYQWGAELSVYLDPACTSRGLGKKLYRMLLTILQMQGIRTVYGGVTLPNIQSEALHRSLGFHILGTYRNAGYKNGKWHDVAWFTKQIAPCGTEPEPITAFCDLPQEWLQAILSSL